jgi:hypothetical protein
VTRPQSPIQITALGIIALPHSQERHARQHHEPARALEKSIEPRRTHPIPPAFSPTEFLRRLRSAEFGGKPITASVIPSAGSSGAFVLQYSLDDVMRTTSTAVTWSGVSSAQGQAGTVWVASAVPVDGVLQTFLAPVAGIRINSTALAGGTFTLKVVQPEGQ